MPSQAYEVKSGNRVHYQGAYLCNNTQKAEITNTHLYFANVPFKFHISGYVNNNPNNYVYDAFSYGNEHATFFPVPNNGFNLIIHTTEQLINREKPKYIGYCEKIN